MSIVNAVETDATTPTRKAMTGSKKSPAKPAVNVGGGERLASVVGGAALGLLGVRRKDAAGLVLLGIGALLVRRGSTGHCPAYDVLNVRTKSRPADPHEYDEHGIHVAVAMTINKPRAKLFQFWRRFENLPQFMHHLKSVETLDDKRSHWVAKAPAGRTVEWDAEIINEVPDELIAWRSLADAQVDNAGSVRFLDAPGNRGTEIKVVIDYIPPAGVVGKWVAKLFGEDPKTQIRQDLRQFKRQMEADDGAMNDR